MAGGPGRRDKEREAWQLPDIKVLSTHAVEEVLRALGPSFERASGTRLVIDYDPANALKRKIDDGATFDVAIVTRPVIEALAARGKIIRESCTDIGRSGLGVAVRKGAPIPDIASADAFRNTLLAARSVARSREGTSGLYFETLLTRLGIAAAMTGKIALGGSGRVAELVARGEADMAVQQIPELLPVKNVHFAGPLPEALQLYTVFAAGISAGSKAEDAARGFINALAAPAASELFTSKGLERVPR
jgi:molybdate transport system substrate-binding protein